MRKIAAAASSRSFLDAVARNVAQMYIIDRKMNATLSVTCYG